MPRYTRDQQFVIAFDDFMVSMRDLYFPNMLEWTLESKNQNKSCSTHTYQLKIPKQIVDYTIDVSFIDENGIQKPNETVKKDQQIPSIENFKNYFHGYFDNFIMSKSDKIVSYTSLYGTCFDENGDFMTNIVVCYYKSYIPYPSKMQSYHQLLEYCNQLEKSNTKLLADLEDQNSNVYHLTIKLNKNKKQFNIKLNCAEIKRKQIIVKMQEKMREFYSKQPENEWEDCPVCYEKIIVDTFTVPGCCHYICKNCHSKCEICPICREKY